MVKTVTNVILPSTPDLLLEEWILLSAFVPVNSEFVNALYKSIEKKNEHENYEEMKTS